MGVHDNVYILFLKPHLSYESALASGVIWLLARNATSAAAGVMTFLFGSPHRHLQASKEAKD